MNESEKTGISRVCEKNKLKPLTRSSLLNGGIERNVGVSSMVDFKLSLVCLVEVIEKDRFG